MDAIQQHVGPYLTKLHNYLHSAQPDPFVQGVIFVESKTGLKRTHIVLGQRREGERDGEGRERRRTLRDEEKRWTLREKP